METVLNPAVVKPMTCFQCEQTENHTANSHGGCTIQGVCGKTPETAALQDLLVYAIKGIGEYAHQLSQKTGQVDMDAGRFVAFGLFSTLTNVNFDPERFRVFLQEAQDLRDRLASHPAAPTLTSPTATFSCSTSDLNRLVTYGKNIGLQVRQAQDGHDLVALQELIVYGLKGASAYCDHAHRLGKEDPEVYRSFFEILSFFASPESKSPEKCLEVALKVGECNYRVMDMLERGHIDKFGAPEPTQCNVSVKKGPAILVSGHDLVDLDAVLQATEGTGINVYTHGEMLPGNAYPGLKKYPHLAGNFGGPWQLQKFEFAQFKGPILITTNCLMEPRKSYRDRIYTTNAVGWPGVKILEDMNQLVQHALSMDGFPENDPEPKNITIGFGKNTILSHAGAVLGAIKDGQIDKFFVIGGCDGSEGERSYFTDLATHLDSKSVVLTMGCGKYRFNKLPFGEVAGFPRLMDMGQCNDAYGAIQVALTLAEALNTDVNSLPIHYAISWFEQKAVAVLLTLLHLGVKRIHLGPRLPAFVPPSTLELLVNTFELAPISTPEKDFPLNP